jgi:SAM-dependent methyltransferase
MCDASFGAESKAWQFSFVSPEQLSLHTLCTKDHPVMYWAPRQLDIVRVVALAEALHGDRSGLPTVVEIGSGSGLLSFLLAKTGRVNVIACEPDQRLVKISQEQYQHPKLQFRCLDAKGAADAFKGDDVACVLNSWMPPGVNLTPAIRDLNAKSIVYVLETRGATGFTSKNDKLLEWTHRETIDDVESYRPGSDYRPLCCWNGPAHWEFVHARNLARWNSQVSAEFANEIRCQVRNDVAQNKEVILQGVRAAKTDQTFLWEAELTQIFGAEFGDIKSE